MAGTEIEKYVPGDEMPRLMQDLRLLDVGAQIADVRPEVAAVEFGRRDHRDGTIEEYTRVEYR